MDKRAKKEKKKKDVGILQPKEKIFWSLINKGKKEPLFSRMFFLCRIKCSEEPAWWKYEVKKNP